MRLVEMKVSYKDDLRRYGEDGACGWRRSFHKFFRLAQNTRNPVLRMWYRWRLKLVKEKRGIEIYYGTKIGKGFFLGHPWGITINAAVVIGENCNVHKGVTIGQENRGVRKGCPIIGNKVWIGINSTIVGNIRVGNDVMIAPNSYVNCDIPDHSIVLGNPCVIRHRDNATEGYVCNCV